MYINKIRPSVISFSFLSSSPLITSIIRGGVISYDGVKRLYSAVWHHIIKIKASKDLNYSYCIPEVVKAKGLTIQEYYLLLKINFFCVGGRTCTTAKQMTLTDYDKVIIKKLKDLALINRYHYNPFTPHRSGSINNTHKYIVISSDGVKLINSVNENIHNHVKVDSMNVVFYNDGDTHEYRFYDQNQNRPNKYNKD